MPSCIQNGTLPVSTTENLNSTRDSVRFTSVSLHANPTTISDAQQVINNFEPLLSFRVVNTTDIHDLLKLTLRVQKALLVKPLCNNIVDDGDDRKRANEAPAFIGPRFPF